MNQALGKSIVCMKSHCGRAFICVRETSSQDEGPVYTIPFSFHIGLGKAVRYENFSCLHDAVFILYRIGFMPLSERFHLKTRKRYEAYRIGAFSCKQEANPI